VKLILQIHDEIVYEIDEKIIAKKSKEGDTTKSEIEEKIFEIMEGVLTEKQTKGVPILVESIYGKNWGELK
jgi:DNA polymerase I-like protein with 3'-5' exonuclease and polymerase domains